MDEEDDSKIFPQKLMEILSNPENTEAICWMPHGKSFIIRDRSAFAEQVMPRYFSRKAKYSSFTRKLNRWNFSRVSSGPEMGAYYHEFFLRDKPQLAAQMFCKNARTLAAMQTAKSGDFKKKDAFPQVHNTIHQASNPPSTLSLVNDSYGMVPGMPSRIDLFERQLLALQREEEANRLLLERALLLQSHHTSPVSLNPLLMREVQQQKLQQERILQMRRAMHQYNANRNASDRQRAPSNNRASAA